MSLLQLRLPTAPHSAKAEHKPHSLGSLLPPCLRQWTAGTEKSRSAYHFLGTGHRALTVGRVLHPEPSPQGSAPQVWGSSVSPRRGWCAREGMGWDFILIPENLLDVHK